MNKIRAVIKGVGGYVPDYVLTNAELERMVDTNDEWITSRTGIKERRILKGEGLGSSDIAFPAVMELLEKTNTDPADIDLLICATTTPDYIFPSTANLLCDRIGAKKAFSYDMQAACSGFLYALATGASFIESGRFKKAIIVGADKMSSIINYQDRATCIIFGDGGGAVLLEAEEDSPYGIQDFVMRTDGSGYPHLNLKAGGSRHPASHQTIAEGMHYIHQEGKAVFKEAVTRMAEVAEMVCQRNNLSGDDIAWLVPHQANKRIIDATAQRVGMDPSKVTINIHKYGNTTNGTIPLCLWEYEKQFKQGDNLLLAAFGGGFTWGSLYLKWAYNS